MDKNAIKQIVTDRIKMSSGLEFQELIWSILSKVYPNLQTPKAKRDFGSDGHDYSTRQFFACYAPEKGKYVAKDTSEKINSDYKKFEDKWKNSKNFDIWNFVVSDNLIGLPHTIISQLQANNDGVEKRVLGQEQIVNLVMTLTGEDISEIFNIPISSIQITDNSNNINTHNKVVTNIGPTTTEISKIVKEVVSDILPIITANTREIMQLRVNEIEKNIIEKVTQRNQEERNKLNDPDVLLSMQSAILNSARQPEKELRDLLANLVIERIKNNNTDERSKNIIFNEAILTISKLSSKQITLLTYLFLMQSTKKHSIQTLFDVVLDIKVRYEPFYLSNFNSTDLSQLQYAGCGYTLQLANSDFYKLIGNKYIKFFLPPLEVSKIKALNINHENDEKIFYEQEGSLHLNPMDFDELSQMITDEKDLKTMTDFLRNSMYPSEEIKKMLTIHYPKIDEIGSQYKRINLGSLILSPVGKAIALTNFETVTKTSIANSDSLFN